MGLKQIILVVALMLLATGCAGDDTAAPTSTTTQPTTPVATTTTTTVATTTTMPVVTDNEEKVAYRSIQEFGENIRQGDVEAAAAFLAPEYAIYGGPEFWDLDFWEFVSILEKPELTDCQVGNETADGSEINCIWVIGEGTWWTQVLGAQVTTGFWAAVDTDGVLTRMTARPPPGYVQAELDFREWIRATHPEDEDRMFGKDYAEVFRFSKESAELHMQHLDEYLAYLETNE